MRLNQPKTIVKHMVNGATVLLLAAGIGHAQQQINLSAGLTHAVLPDGSSVPMWGYTCGTPVANSTATCFALNPTAAGAGQWSPVVITVPTGQNLRINLTNNLSFTPAGASSPNKVPTSVMIVGQIGGGLGDFTSTCKSPTGTPSADGSTCTPSPSHDIQGTTWPIANTGTAFTPPAQGPRVQSFSTEVPAGQMTSLTWANPNAGTYLMESGTHPSIQATMGLVGMVVVTNAPSSGSGTAYPNVAYNAEVPLLFSEIDPMQNVAVDAAVNTSGFLESAVRGNFGGPVTGVVVTAGGTGYKVPPTVTFDPSAENATATAQIDVDPNSPTYGQVIAITVLTGGTYASTTNVYITPAAGDTGSGAAAIATQRNSNTVCSDGAAACYPSVVNYRPLYYLINGAAFDKTNASASVFAVTQGTNSGTVSGNVLVRMVNAGSRMHVPSIVGSTYTGSSSSKVAGFALIAEDGNALPGVPRVQSEVFMPAGKTYDVMIDAPPSGSSALGVFDRELSLSANAINHDAGMLGYISVNGATAPVNSVIPTANPDNYSAVITGQTLNISDPGLGVIANDLNISGVRLMQDTSAHNGTLSLNADGTFTYVPNGTWNPTTANQTGTTDSFTYCGNGATSGAACSTVTFVAAKLEAVGGIQCPTSLSFASNLATKIKMSAPGVLSTCTDAAGLPLTATKLSSISGSLNVNLNTNGAFEASVPQNGAYSFTFIPRNSQGVEGQAVTVNLTFPPGGQLKVSVVDGSDKKTQISDYRWIIEEDRTFFVDPKCTINPPPAGCPGSAGGVVPNFGTSFHTSDMPVIASGCTGPISCGADQTILGQPAPSETPSSPADVAQCTNVPAGTPCLNNSRRYYISVLPGDAAQPFIAGYAGAPDCTPTPDGSDHGTGAGQCGHGMGGAPIPAGSHNGQSITVLTQPSPYPPATLTGLVFEDDYPLNGEVDSGGGIDVLSPNEPGLGGFQITLQDVAGGTGDATGTPTYDMFNMPLSNSLAGTLDPTTGLDACPLSTTDTANQTPDPKHPGYGLDGTLLGSQKGIVGMIITCPKYEADGSTLSPLAGQFVVKNLYQGRYGVVANPGADRISRGEEWLQTNTLDGQKAHDSFMRIGEPGYFQEFGPAGYHVTIGFANPKIINDRGKTLCNAPGAQCNHYVKGHVTLARMSRTPDERLYGSGTRDAYGFTQCFVSIGDPDGAEFGFVKCDADGNFVFPKGTVPDGNWKITTFDQWNDQVVDGISTPIGMCSAQSSIDPNPVTGCNDVDMGEVAAHQWQADIYTRTFIDVNGDGVSNVDASGNPTEPGLTFVDTNIRFRDGSFSNFNSTDLNGYASFNEVFPLFNWYVIETDSTRYKNTGTHVVYDSGGPVDGSKPDGTHLCSDSGSNTKPCGDSTVADHLANTYEPHPLPADLHVPGAVYCADADCSSESITKDEVSGAVGSNSPQTSSTGRIDPPWVNSEAWQGYAGQANFLEFGKKPFAEGENGGIHGHVVYASTRPFDDPQLLLQLSWEPLVANVRVNLYQEGVAADGITKTLKLIDFTQTSSWDAWAQGVRADGKPNMNCPGQGTDDPNDLLGDPYFWYALKDQPQYLDLYENSGNVVHPLPYDSRYKCYDGMHNWNQLQPAPYDGAYSFPSVTGMDPITGKPTGTNCTACIANPDSSDPYRSRSPMLPDGKYVVEVVVPPGYELVKEEDKNILIGDNYIAPVTQQFGGLGSIFILPDQAEVAEAYNANNNLNATDNLGRTENLPSHEGDTGNVETYWPCVGEERVVPDFISLFPGSQEVSPFAGATRPLCDRKEVTLTDQTSALAKFYIFTETHKAAHFTGVITDDFTAEFDPYSPQFGEKFAPSYLPVSVKDWAGNEINRVYSDAWGIYNGLNYSTWEVNPPNPTGYGPTTMVMCMNDPGPLSNGNSDPLFQSGYSDFCYELPFMPGQTGYFDTPVVPTSGFAGGYNTPDCSYPNATPAVKQVTGDVAGPWVSAPGNQLTITALGDQLVDNYEYSGPQSTAAPYNQQKIKRHYGFGSAPTAFAKFASHYPSGTTFACNGGDSSKVCPFVTIGGKGLTGVSWSDTQITGNVPSNVDACPVQQQTIYGGSAAQCGELVITPANGQQSVDTVTVTIGGKQPTVLTSGETIQTAIDSAQPGDLIIVPAGTYSEMLLMWKPVRLQGVGAASSIIDANPHPAGKLDPWRRQLVCLFGLTLNGIPQSQPGKTNAYDPSNTFTCSDAMKFSIDRLPLEATVGWDATLNGHLAEQLIEPTLMGALEGAGITVLSKGVKFPDPSHAFDSDVFPDGTQLLTDGDCLDSNNSNPYPSNFLCNPSSIDGLTVKNSSQGGGGIMVHAWGHRIQIANNRVLNNQGTLSGGITIGQGEHPDAYLAGGTASTVPGSCVLDQTGLAANQALPYCYDMDVNVHNNLVVQNSSLGDELFSSTPAGAGGVTFCNGSDYYNFNYNWVCGNMATGDGAGVAHVGLSYDGTISHNTIQFNESTNPTIVTNGAGLIVMGAPDVDPPCGLTTDQDCLSAPGTLTPSDGAGPGLVIDANLIVGNAADAGSGGGLRLQHINGNEVLNFPNANVPTQSNGAPRIQVWPDIPGHDLNAKAVSDPASPRRLQALTTWNAVSITNNVIANNVAGWDGGGVSLLDALAVDFVNNTVTSNNTTASAGVLFQTLFAPLASTGGTNCTVSLNGQTSAGSCPQPAGLVSVTNSAILAANMQNLSGGLASIQCPVGHGSNTTNSTSNCTQYSVPSLFNDVFWKNRAFMIGVGGLGSNLVNQQNVVSMYDPGFTGGGLNPTPTGSQTATGSCNTSTNSNYWDIGIRGQARPGDSSIGQLAPKYSVLTNSGALSEVGAGSNNLITSDASPMLNGTYCNGSRVPVEAQLAGVAYAWQVPPGTNESNALPAPPFTLLPGAVTDEGNNWINLRWGPLSQKVTDSTGNPVFTFDPSENPTSTSIYYIPSSVSHPATDFWGNARPNPNIPAWFDPGAIQNESGVPALTLTSITPAQGNRNTTVAVTFTGTNLNTVNSVTAPAGSGIMISSVTRVSQTTLTANFTIAKTAPTGPVTITVVAPGSRTATTTFTVNGPSLTSINPSSGLIGTSVNVTFTGSGLTGSTGVVGWNSTVTVTNYHVVSDTQVTATFSISKSATLGDHSITLTAPSGNANPVTFTVIAPTFTGYSPTSGLRGTTVSVVFTGQNLQGSTSVGGLGNGISLGTLTVAPNGTSVTANLVISGTASTSATHNLTLISPSGSLTAGPFTVVAPAIATLVPNSGVRGSSVNVTFNGTNLSGTTGVSGWGTAVTVTGYTVNQAGTQASATFNLGSAMLGNHNLVLTYPGGSTNNLPFNVTGGTLQITAPSPSLRTNTANTLVKSGTITVTNTATGSTAGPVTFTAAPSVTTSTTGAGTFSMTGGTCVSGLVLNPGNSCTVVVQYDPKGSTTTASGSVTLTVSGTGSPTQTSGLSGN